MPCSENSYSRMTTALLATRMADMQAGNSVSLKVQQTLIFPLTIWLNVGEVGLKAHFCYNSLYTHFHVTDINRYKYFREGVDLKNRLTKLSVQVKFHACYPNLSTSYSVHTLQ